MCRVALINPPNLVAAGQEGENAVPPLGLAYIAAVLRQHGFTAEIFDFAERPSIRREELERLRFSDYELYGFTAYTKTFRGALPSSGCWARPGRRQRSSSAALTRRRVRGELLETYPEIDVVVRNEGELATLRLARHVACGEPPLEEIAGLVYRAPDGGIIENPDPLDLVVLDELPHPIRDYRVSPSPTTPSRTADTKSPRGSTSCRAAGGAPSAARSARSS